MKHTYFEYVIPPALLSCSEVAATLVVRDYFHHPGGPLSPASSQSPAPQPPFPLTGFSCCWRHINGAVKHIFWLLSLNILPCVSVMCIYLKSPSRVPGERVLQWDPVHSLVPRYLDCFQLWAAMNRTSTNILSLLLFD